MGTGVVTAPAAPEVEVGEHKDCRPMRADARRNYERILVAARQVFAEHGTDTSMEEIAKAADVGVGTLYRRFPRRIDLVEAVYLEDVDGLVALADQVAVDHEPWDGLVAWLHGFVLYAQSKRTFLTELREAFDKSPDKALASRQKIIGAMGAVLSRAQAAGAARTDLDGPDLMHLVGGMCMAAQSTLEQNERLLVLVLDGIRTR